MESMKNFRVFFFFIGVKDEKYFAAGNAYIINEKKRFYSLGYTKRERKSRHDEVTLLFYNAFHISFSFK